MNIPNRWLVCGVLAAAAFLPAGARAQSAAEAAASAASAKDMTEGEVRRIDQAIRAVTLRHGDIPNVGMPAMTMAFRLDDAAALQALKVGDKVRFRVGKKDGALIITEIRPAS